MNVVIYTDQLEPITIIDLPLRMLHIGYKHRIVRVAVPLPVVDYLKIVNTMQYLEDIETHIVTLEFDRLMKRNKRGEIVESWIITTDNEVMALKLKPSWLPGQQRRINEYNQTISDLVSALMGVLGNG